MPRITRVGLAQVSPVPYAAEPSRAATTRAAQRAFLDGADVVVLPELAVPGYGLDREELRRVAERVDGPTVAAWQTLAAAAGGLIVGGLCERDGDDLYNTAVAVSGDGIQLHYRKLHPFGVEKHVFAPGNLGLPVSDTAWGRIGVCICYDLRFVETLRILALCDAELVCVPTAWVRGFDQAGDAAQLPPQAHGALLQANLNQVFLACASQAGRPADHDLLGASLLGDPWGRVVGGPLAPDRDETVVVAIDLDDVERSRSRGSLIHPRADRRTDVYGLAVGGRVL